MSPLALAIFLGSLLHLSAATKSWVSSGHLAHAHLDEHASLENETSGLRQIEVHQASFTKGHTDESPPDSLKVAHQDWWTDFAHKRLESGNFSHLHKASHWNYLDDWQYRQLVNHAADQMKPPIHGHDKVFEVGMGVGAALKVLKERHPNITVGGSDVTEDAVKVAKKVFGDGKTMPLVVNDMRLKHEGVPDGAADHVVSFGALGMYMNSKEEMLKAIAEAARMTKPGGSVLFTSLIAPDGHNKGSIQTPIEKSFWASALPKLGLKNIEVHSNQMQQGDRYSITATKE